MKLSALSSIYVLTEWKIVEENLHVVVHVSNSALHMLTLKRFIKGGLLQERVRKLCRWISKDLLEDNQRSIKLAYTHFLLPM